MLIDGREVPSYKITQDFDEIRVKDKQKKVLVADFDDTLALSAIKHYQLILDSKHIDKYKQYMDLQPMSNRFFYNRSNYYTIQWLKKPEVEKIPTEISEEIIDLFNLPNFYDDVKPTKFGMAVKEYLKEDFCEKVYVVSHCLSKTAINAKMAWLDRYYGSKAIDKIEFIATGSTEKSIPLIERGIKWDIFADDRLECCIDVVLYAEGFGNEILIPEFGYNKPTERFTNLVEKFNLQTFYINVL